MFHGSPRLTLAVIVTQAIILIAASGSDLRRPRGEAGAIKKHRTAGQTRPVTRPRGGSFLAREVAALIKKRRRRGRPLQRTPGVATQVSLVGLSHKSKHRMAQAGWLNRGIAPGQHR